MQLIMRQSTSLWIGTLLALTAGAFFVSGQPGSPEPVSAHSGDIFGPACGAATIDGQLDRGEWDQAATQTFQMLVSSGAPPFTATLHVMNSRNYLYLGLTLNDDEFSLTGQYLAYGDTLRIDFDNDHSGALFALSDDMLDLHAGLPQFTDSYIVGEPTDSSSAADVAGGGTADGAGVASRVLQRNHFELKHPLCSGEPLDYCLQPGDTLGFRLEYLDAEADGSFGSAQFFPGSASVSEADIVIGQCAAEATLYLPLIMK